VDTGNCSVERPCFLWDHIKPPYRGSRQNRLKGILIGHVKFLNISGHFGIFVKP